MKSQRGTFSLAHATPTTQLNFAPVALPSAQNKIPFGVYKGALPKMNFRAIAKHLGMNPLRRRIAEKRWRFASIFSEELVCTAAIIHAGPINAYFAYIFDRRSQTLHEIKGEYPVPLGPDVNLTPGAERVSFNSGDISINIFTKLDGSVELDVSCPQFTISATLQTPENPLVLVSRVPDINLSSGKDSVNVTRKCLGMKVIGQARIGTEQISLNSGFGMVDDTAGLLARRTTWHWINATGRSKTPDSPIWGVNLVAEHNDYDYTENAIWRNGKLTYVGRARFEFDPENPLQPWHVTTDDAVIDLWFNPEGSRVGRFETPILASIYDSPLGSFSGTILGEEVTGLTGLAENHHALW